MAHRSLRECGMTDSFPQQVMEPCFPSSRPYALGLVLLVLPEESNLNPRRFRHAQTSDSQFPIAVQIAVPKGTRPNKLSKDAPGLRQQICPHQVCSCCEVPARSLSAPLASQQGGCSELRLADSRGPGLLPEIRNADMRRNCGG
jgi:hypothetical protein